jgi:hypothetical protein
MHTISSQKAISPLILHDKKCAFSIIYFSKTDILSLYIRLSNQGNQNILLVHKCHQNTSAAVSAFNNQAPSHYPNCLYAQKS